MSTGLDELLDHYRLEGDDRQFVADAYRVFRENHGPFITGVAAQMLPDLHRDAAEGRTIAFLGRDGHPYAVAVAVLDPDFFERSCREIVVSRVVVEAAIQNREQHRRARLLDVGSFRRAQDRVDPAIVPGAYRNLTRYLRASGVSVGRKDSKVTLIDSGFRGTVQELLAALYPEPDTDFRGRYAAHGAVIGDPHPDSKYGYLVDLLPAANIYDGSGNMLRYLPDDPALTFATLRGLQAIEFPLNGTLGTATAIVDGRPNQIPLRDDTAHIDGFNPASVQPPLRDPLVLEATKAAALLAVHDAAVQAARERDAGQDWTATLAAQRDRFTGKVRAWLKHDPDVEPALRTLLDGLVPPEDYLIHRDFDSALGRHGLTPDDEMRLWQRLARCRTAGEKEEFTARIRAAGKPEVRSLIRVLTAAETTASRAAATTSAQDKPRVVRPAGSVQRDDSAARSTAPRRSTPAGRSMPTFGR